MSQRHLLERILEIDRQIRAGLYPNADKLAAEMEWSRSTIFEDRNFMIDRFFLAPMLQRWSHPRTLCVHRGGAARASRLGHDAGAS